MEGAKEFLQIDSILGNATHRALRGSDAELLVLAMDKH